MLHGKKRTGADKSILHGKNMGKIGHPKKGNLDFVLTGSNGGVLDIALIVTLGELRGQKSMEPADRWRQKPKSLFFLRFKSSKFQLLVFFSPFTTP